MKRLFAFTRLLLQSALATGSCDRLLRPALATGLLQGDADDEALAGSYVIMQALR